MAHKCNEFIIKNGKFIRDFDTMYQSIEDPWDQELNYSYCFINRLTLMCLSDVISVQGCDVNTILDIGCAAGCFSDDLLLLSGGNGFYKGLDISQSVIDKAKNKNKNQRCTFDVGDIRCFNKNFECKFDLVFSSKTIYYVAPEIDVALENINKYLNENGLFCFNYNAPRDAFSNQWLTYELLREKLFSLRFSEKRFIEVNRLSQEVCAIGVFQKGRW